MKIKKITLILFALILLNGCIQSTAMVGPAVTLATSGNVAQASFSFGANKAVESETGMTTTELLSNKFDESLKSEQDHELYESLKILVDLNIDKTRKKLKNN